MEITTELLLKCSYFFVFLFSIIVFFDVLIKFKSPIRLKIFFLVFVLALLVSAFCLFIRTSPDQFALIRMICPMLIGTSMVQIFTNLYFIQHKRVANIYLISAYAIYMYLIFYVQIVGYDTVFTKANGTILPMYLDILINIDFVFFNLFCLYYIYNILFKFSFQNVYFKKIQIWTFCFFMVILTQLIFIVLFAIFKFPTEFNTCLRIVFGLTLLLIILYRPDFINKNGSKISFGFLFSKEQHDADINEVDFNFHFFTSFYYKNKAADIAEFANIMGVSKEIMFKFIYFKYSLSFDELVNKSRVEYFVQIVKLPKFKDYTIEALALEVGFASRQRFYQPFKKYHGGNPSDLIDVITS